MAVLPEYQKQGIGPHSGWVRDFMSPERLRYKLDEVLEAESPLIGRVTYESFAAAWPERSDREHRADQDVERVAERRSEIGEFADKMNTMPKHVVSTTLRDPKWNNSRVIKGDENNLEPESGIARQDGEPDWRQGEKTALIRLGLEALIARESARRLADLGGSQKRLRPIPRRRSGVA